VREKKFAPHAYQSIMVIFMCEKGSIWTSCTMLFQWCMPGLRTALVLYSWLYFLCGL